MEVILLAKALHVVGFISWFAGLFYLGRVLVNHAEADRREEPARSVLYEEYVATADRVYRIIVNPAMMITWVGGLTMVSVNPGYFVSGTPGWLFLKLAMVILLVVYQVYTKVKLKGAMARGQRPFRAWALRLWNEVPTFFLVVIVFTATLGKVGELNYLYLAIGVAIFCGLVYRGAVAYRKRRLDVTE